MKEGNTRSESGTKLVSQDPFKSESPPNAGKAGSGELRGMPPEEPGGEETSLLSSSDPTGRRGSS